MKIKYKFNKDKLWLTADGGGGNYFILKTKRWAINDVQELVDLLNDFKKRTK